MVDSLIVFLRLEFPSAGAGADFEVCRCNRPRETEAPPKTKKIFYKRLNIPRESNYQKMNIGEESTCT